MRTVTYSQTAGQYFVWRKLFSKQQMSCCRNVTSFLRLSCFINRKSSRDVGIFWRWRTHVLIFRCRPCKYFLMTWRYPENKRGYKKNSPFLDRLVWLDRDSEHGSLESSGQTRKFRTQDCPGLFSEFFGVCALLWSAHFENVCHVRVFRC